MQRIKHTDPDFEKRLQKLILGLHSIPPDLMSAAEKIFMEVVKKGDAALFKHIRKLDGAKLDKKTIEVSKSEIDRAVNSIPNQDAKVLRLAAGRVRAFHKRQVVKGFRFNDGKGAALEERVIPLARVGIYIPAGRAPLASTVLMCAIPARLAGVGEIVMTTPSRDGTVNPHVLTAAREAGVDRIYKAGGAHAIAALASGETCIPRADKIVGPGNAWVAAAKMIAFSRGLCGIDSIAGPSEVAIIADQSADPEFAAWDLLSQAEHGPGSSAIAITHSKQFFNRLDRALDQAIKEFQKQNQLSAKETARLGQRISLVLVKNPDQAAELSNRIAPEHLELMVREPKKILAKIKNAASVFLGPFSPVPIGDYLAGANHVLPTGGTAAWSSPLGVYDFVKRQSVTELSQKSLALIAPAAARFAELEGLPAHAASIRKRLSR